MAKVNYGTPFVCVHFSNIKGSIIGPKRHWFIWTPMANDYIFSIQKLLLFFLIISCRNAVGSASIIFLVLMASSFWAWNRVRFLKKSSTRINRICSEFGVKQAQLTTYLGPVHRQNFRALSYTNQNFRVFFCLFQKNKKKLFLV